MSPVDERNYLAMSRKIAALEKKVKLLESVLIIQPDQVTLKSDGSIIIEGMTINLKSKANIELDGGVNLDLKAQAQATLESDHVTVVKGSVVYIN